MAKYRVWSGGNGTGGADNTNWAQAYTTFALANAAAAANDIILIHYAHQEDIAVNTSVTLAAGTTIVAVDKDASEAYRAMNVDGWIGTSTGAFDYILTCGATATAYGLTVRIGGTASDTIIIRQSDGSSLFTEDLYLWLGSTHTASRIHMGGTATNGAQTYGQHLNLTLRFGNASQRLDGHGKIEIIGGGVSSAGSSVTTMMNWGFLANVGGAECTWVGGDLTHVTGTLTGNSTRAALTYKFIQCRLHSSVSMLGTQTDLNRSSAEVYIIDCSDNADPVKRGRWEFHNMLGSVIREETIYVTAGATGWSWKVVGTSNATIHAPFHTPWIDFYNGTNTAITPRLEIFRDASTTAFTDAEVWAEWLAKTTSGSDRAAFAGSDRQALNAILAGTAGVAQATGVGTGSWATGGGADWSGKCDSGSAITAAEDGYLRGRIAVVGAVTVYVDPQIRTD